MYRKGYTIENLTLNSLISEKKKLNKYDVFRILGYYVSRMGVAYF